jgi:hypothetical protein
MKKNPRSKQRSPRFTFEYVTSTVSLLVVANQGDGIGVSVVNDSGVSENARAVIYQTTGAGAIIAADSGNAAVPPTWRWGLGFTISESGEYWIRVQVSSEFLIPQVWFQRFQNGIWVPIESYRPGDFAVFRLKPSRKRHW